MRHRFLWAPVALMLVVGSTSWSAAQSGRRIVFPAGSVLKVRMDETISSNRNDRGDRFTATVSDEAAGYDLPDGTRVEGVITDVRRAREGEPGMLDVEFRALRLPDGQSYRIVGVPTSLDSRSVQRTSDGRLVSRSTSKNRTKFIAYGAGAGFIIGSLLGENITGALLGAAAGYLYGKGDKDKRAAREVVLKPGTEFGVRLDQRLALAPTWDDRNVSPRVGGYRSDDRDDVRYRSEYRYRDESYRSDGRYSRDGALRVLVNDRPVRFGTARPFRSGGQWMVPLAPVLNAADVEFEYDRTDREVTIDRPREVRLAVGSSIALVDGRRVQLGAPARIVNGSLFVPAAFFEHAVDMDVQWDEARDTLILSSAR